MLLTEYRPFNVDRQLVEQSIKENRSLVVKGVIQRAEAKNQNGRVYPKEILEREIQKYIAGPVKERRALGDLKNYSEMELLLVLVLVEWVQYKKVVMVL
jgi:hypothetical protein